MLYSLSLYFLFRKVQPEDALLWITFLTFKSQEQNFLEMQRYRFRNSNARLQSLWEDLGAAGRPWLLGIGRPRDQVQNEPEQCPQMWPHL